MIGYLKQFAITALILLVLVAGLNWSVDPFAIWHNRCIEGLNCRKTEAGTRIYLTKAYQWRHLAPKIIILGNSRPELGLDPNSKQFNGDMVYNLAMRGASISTQVKYLVNLLQIHHPERVLLNIDFLDFLQLSGTRANWPPVVSDKDMLPYTFDGKPNQNYKLNNLVNRTKSLLSLDSTFASIGTLFRQNGNVNYTTLKGFNKADGFLPKVTYEGATALFDQKKQELFKRLKGKKFSLYDSEQQSTGFSALRYIIQELIKRDIKVDLFISPYHMSYLKILDENDVYKLFVSWKMRLVDELKKIKYFERLRLYDFSGFNRYTKEPVPEGKGVFMRWHWEPSHYRAELGNIIIEHLLSDNKEFQLNPTNLNSRMAEELSLNKQANLTLISKKKANEK